MVATFIGGVSSGKRTRTALVVQLVSLGNGFGEIEHRTPLLSVFANYPTYCRTISV